MSKFFVDAALIDGNQISIINKDDVRHITRVLRKRPGDVIEISDGSGWEYTCEIGDIQKDIVVAEIIDKHGSFTEPGVKITLFQGIPKGAKMDDVVRKCTELGVSRIVPVFMQRTVVKDKGNYSKKVQRMRSIASEASKQSRRSVIMQVDDACDLGCAINVASECDMIILPYENEDEVTIKQILRDVNEQPEPASVAVFIGPEGGFSGEEADMISAAGGIKCSLGKSILRTETAGIVASSMILYELEL